LHIKCLKLQDQIIREKEGVPITSNLFFFALAAIQGCRCQQTVEPRVLRVLRRPLPQVCHCQAPWTSKATLGQRIFFFFNLRVFARNIKIERHPVRSCCQRIHLSCVSSWTRCSVMIVTNVLVVETKWKNRTYRQQTRFQWSTKMSRSARPQLAPQPPCRLLHRLHAMAVVRCVESSCTSPEIFFLIILGIPEWAHVSQGFIWFEVSILWTNSLFIGSEHDSREAFKRSISVDIIRVTRESKQLDRESKQLEDASKCLCTKIPLFKGVEQQKTRQNPLEMLSPTRCECHVFTISFI